MPGNQVEEKSQVDGMQCCAHHNLEEMHVEKVKQATHRAIAKLLALPVPQNENEEERHERRKGYRKKLYRGAAAMFGKKYGYRQFDGKFHTLPTDITDVISETFG
mmetsp:Transcript_27211/g.44695  ORF Transcript_27211/g.44695 Transcript_27211/m.44695 type:complete len:105 (-) Transcript_27211:288-602(-)